MDIKKYEVLLEVAEKGSFVKAATSLGYSHTGITRMMNSLEKECGFQLFVRSNKGVELSKDARRILPLVRQLVASKEAMEELYGEIRGLHLGKLRIVGLSSVVVSFILPVLDVYKKLYPEVQLDVMEENSSRILEDWMASGLADIAILNRQPTFSFEWISLFKDPNVVVFPKGNPLEACDTVRAWQLQDAKFLMMTSPYGHDPDIPVYLRQNHVQVHPFYSSNANYSFFHMMDSPEYVSILPKMIYDGYQAAFPDILCRPLYPPLSRDIVLAVRSFSECTVAARHFIECARDWVAAKRHDGT